MSVNTLMINLLHTIIASHLHSTTNLTTKSDSDNIDCFMLHYSSFHLVLLLLHNYSIVNWHHHKHRHPIVNKSTVKVLIPKHSGFYFNLKGVAECILLLDY